MTVLSVHCPVNYWLAKLLYPFFLSHRVALFAQWLEILIAGLFKLYLVFSAFFLVKLHLHFVSDNHTTDCFHGAGVLWGFFFTPLLRDVRKLSFLSAVWLRTHSCWNVAQRAILFFVSSRRLL